MISLIFHYEKSKWYNWGERNGIMAVHIFLMNETNYEICTRRGLVGLP